MVILVRLIATFITLPGSSHVVVAVKDSAESHVEIERHKYSPSEPVFGHNLLECHLQHYALRITYNLLEPDFALDQGAIVVCEDLAVLEHMTFLLDAVKHSVLGVIVVKERVLVENRLRLSQVVIALADVGAARFALAFVDQKQARRHLSFLLNHLAVMILAQLHIQSDWRKLFVLNRLQKISKRQLTFSKGIACLKNLRRALILGSSGACSLLRTDEQGEMGLEGWAAYFTIAMEVLWSIWRQ